MTQSWQLNGVPYVVRRARRDDEASRRGCALVQLTTDASRSDALRFYERHGFVPSHVGLKLPIGWAARGSNPEPAD